MKAVVIERPHYASWRDVETPSVGPHDVLVRSREAGLCRTDIEMMTGEFTDPRWVRYPIIPGHEWSGTVAEIGSEVAATSIGDRVVCEGFISCHRCRRCRAGDTHWCENIEALGFTRPGGYAEFVSVPEQVVHPLPDDVSFDAGVLIEPASVVLSGLDKARPAPGEAVGVIGVGTLGGVTLELLKLYSPSRIVAFGVREEELTFALQLGADEVVLVGEQSPATSIGEEFDLVVETAGAPSAVRLATDLCRPSGRALLLGIAGEGRDLMLPSDRLVGKDMALIGSIAYPAHVWSRVVALVSDGVVRLDPVVTHRFPASRFEDAVRLMEQRQGIVAKIVLEHAA
jgi:2-desacetyl-2-hydroxyethyl bacteriochlorophyllide A dehydrogenase